MKYFIIMIISHVWYKSVFNLCLHVLTDSSCTGESITTAESAGVTVAGSFLGGVVAGGAAALLVVGILCGSWKLKHSMGKSCKVNSEEQ